MKTFLRHALLWILVYVIYTYMMFSYEDLSHHMVSNLVNVPLFMVAYYLLKHVQIPYLYNRDKMVAFVVSLLASSLMIGAVCRINGILWMDEYFGYEEDIPFITLGGYLLRTVRYYTPAMALLAWESHRERRKEMERMQQLEKEKIANELKFLKAQINPHFLFNTLNNLYSCVVTQSPKAPHMIMQLSGILDYVLYKSQHHAVQLGDEVKTIEHFLKLEQIRYGERLRVSFKSEGNMSASISPLLLLSIVENAFKHGASGDIDFPKIEIEIREKDASIFCNAWNTKSQYTGEINDDYKQGIGLTNLKRQLNLVYPDQHELVIGDLKESFSVSLAIKPVV